MTRVLALVVTSVLPKVPTMAEAGFRGFEITQWQGFFAPAGTDRAILSLLNREIEKALKLPDDLKLYSRLIREAGIKAE